MATYALAARNLVKIFGPTRALDGLSLTIKRGEIYGLLGPNGAGKTTVLRIICGTLEPDEGEGRCLDAPFGTRAAGLGYMPQRGGLYHDLTIFENLQFYARAYGLKKSVVVAAIETHGLGTHVNQRVAKLSGGWTQRVALAAALLPAPRLILLDEPTAGLDQQARESLWRRLRDLATSGVSMLVTSHYADEAERCDRIGYLSAGKLLAEGIPRRLPSSLGLRVWLLDMRRSSQPPPPDIAGVRYLQDSAGWRAITRNQSSMPAKLADWCCSRGLVAEAIEPRLGDALSWLASGAEESR